jgi:transcriptional regulator with XRE-family HTH domain
MAKAQKKFPNRIREIREAKVPKMTLEKLAELTELSVGYLSKLEAGKQPLNGRIMPRIASALGVKPSELIDSAKAWLETDITCIISQNHEVQLVHNSEKNGQRLTTTVPAALGEVEAALVVGNHLYPRYDDGDVITFDLRDKSAPEDLIGKECVITLTNDLTFIKTIVRGSGPNLYHLTSFNAPPVYDVEIKRAIPVRWVGRS